MSKISVVLATFNEEENIAECLDSVKNFASEIVIVDGSSTDGTVEIAREYTDKITVTENHPIFHINKQKAIDKAENEWILQLDADERVTHELGSEIERVAAMSDEELEMYEEKLLNRDLFSRHMKLLEERDGKVGKEEGEYSAFFIPRRNFFLGKYLRYGGVYPDGVIRLIRKGKAFLPCKSVHEQMVVEGRVGWLQNDLLHKDSPTFGRYLERNSRYINLIVKEFKRDGVEKNFSNGVKYFLVKPIWWFLLTQIRHKGILDGIQGIIFSLFSALRFPRAYFRYLGGKS